MTGKHYYWNITVCEIDCLTYSILIDPVLFGFLTMANLYKAFNSSFSFDNRNDGDGRMPAFGIFCKVEALPICTSRWSCCTLNVYKKSTPSSHPMLPYPKFIIAWQIKISVACISIIKEHFFQDFQMKVKVKLEWKEQLQQEFLLKVPKNHQNSEPYCKLKGRMII